MKIMITFVAVLAFASVGCKKKKGAEGGDCAAAINNSMSLSKAEMEKTPGMDAAMIQKMMDLGAQHCKDDKWSADAIKCMTDAKTMADAQGCYGKLSPEQQKKMNQAVMDMAMSQQHAGGSADSGSAGSAGSAAGSDSAATGSGSAAAETGSGSAAGSAAAPK